MCLFNNVLMKFLKNIKMKINKIFRLGYDFRGLGFVVWGFIIKGEVGGFFEGGGILVRF